MPTNLRPYNENYEKHGLWEIYYDNDQVDYKGEFINNQKHGLHESYWEDGELFSIGTYDMDKKVGYWKRTGFGRIEKIGNEVIYKTFYAD